MIRYEYLTKHFTDFHRAYPDLTLESLSKWLSTFGAEGWELTLVVSEPVHEWYFRRPLPEPLAMAPMPLMQF